MFLVDVEYPSAPFWFSVLRATKRLIWLSQLIRVHRNDRNQRKLKRDFSELKNVNCLCNSCRVELSSC